MEKVIVGTQSYKIQEPITLSSGEVLDNIEIAYEIYGKLNKNKDNAILVLHALTGDAHSAFYNSNTDKQPGWWNDLIGSGKAFDTDKYFVISTNILGGCKGTTGPRSVNPKTGKEYCLDFPVITVKDMVIAQKKLIDNFGIKKLIVAGGSLGGMQAMEWSILYPDIVSHCILIATAGKQSAQNVALHYVGRKAIMSDPNWNNGNYYNSVDKPNYGLSVARMIGHITYLCNQSFDRKFARRFQNSEKPHFTFAPEFEVESYLEHQGDKFINRFDANSYLYITKAVDYFDLEYEYGSFEKAFSKTKANFLVISFASDWLYPPEQSKTIVKALKKVKKKVKYYNIKSNLGHDAFLLEHKKQTKIIKKFLKKYKN